MWERVLYLNCQLLSDATDVASDKKLQMVGDLYGKFGQNPPPIVNNTAINSAPNSIIIQGDNNNVPAR